MPTPLIWNFKITGADEARRQLQEVGKATRGAKDDSTEYSKSLREQARDANAVIRADEYRSRILVAQQPILRNVMQGVSMLSSITRSAVAVQTMWNTAMLLAQGTTSDVIANQDELARVQIEYNDLVSKGLGNTVKGQELREQIVTLNHKIKESSMSAANAQLNLAFAFVTGGAQIAASIVQLIPKLTILASSAVVTGTTYSGALASMSTATRIFGVTTTTIMAASPWIALAAAIAIVAVLIVTHWDDVVKFFNTYVLPAFQALWKGFQVMGNAIVEAGKFLWNALTLGFTELGRGLKTVWDGIVQMMTQAWADLKKGFVALWNGFATIANAGIGAITKGIEFFVNGAVDALNVLISAYNAAVAIVGGRGISLIGHIAISPPQIPVIAAAAGFDGIVNQPTLFVAGEGGQSEHVSIGSGNNGNFGRGGGRGGENNIFITVQGSIWSEREITDKVLRALDIKFQDKGW